MLFGRHKHRVILCKELNMVVNGEKLPVSDVGRNLGLFIDSELRFKQYVDKYAVQAYGAA